MRCGGCACCVRSTAGFLCAQATSHNEYCVADLAPLATELEGKPLSELMGAITGSLATQCASGCIAKLGAHQKSIAQLVTSFGGATLSGL